MHSQKRSSYSKSAVTKPISECVRITCSGLMITSLLQVVYRLAASCELHAGIVSPTCSESANIKLHQVWCSQTWCNVMKSTGLIQLAGNLHQACRIHNLHQVCRIFGCVLIFWSVHQQKILKMDPDCGLQVKYLFLLFFRVYQFDIGARNGRLWRRTR